MEQIVPVSDYIKEQTDEISKKCILHTHVLYSVIPNRVDRAEPVASCLLLKCDDNYFLISASHVIKEGKLALHFNNTLLPIDISEDSFFTKMEREEDDKLDILIVKLTSPFVAALPPYYSFFDLRTLNIDFDDVEISSYLVVGYPLTRFKLNPTEQIISIKPFAFRTHIHTDGAIHQKLKTFNNTNLILHYRKRKIKNNGTGENVEGPNPKGLSGCGVWLIANLLEGKNSFFFPVGILIEHDNRYCALTITRINVITEIIRVKWNIDIPQSKKVNLNFLSNENFTFE